MQQFEYRQILMRVVNGGPMQVSLDEMGAEGWMLATSFPSPSPEFYVFIFQRAFERGRFGGR